MAELALLDNSAAHFLKKKVRTWMLTWVFVFRFKAQSVYNHHLLTHSDARNYKCPYCPKTFKTSVQLSGHKNSHTKPFTCTDCNRPFGSLYAVRAHMDSHKRPNHNLKHICDICGAKYARRFALNDHMKEQHKEVQLVQIVDVSNRMWKKEQSSWIKCCNSILSVK